MLNIIIRTSYRPKAFERCMISIGNNLFTGRIIVGYDDDRALTYLREYIGVDLIRVERKSESNFFYNEYLNDLICHTEGGHIIFLDDDDELIDGSIQQLNLRKNRSAIVPFLRNGRWKPNYAMMQAKSVQPGYIGLPSLILATDHIPLIHFDDTEFSDYNAIRQLERQTEFDWIRVPVVSSEKRNFGAMENIVNL